MALNASYIIELERHWDFDIGFFGKLRRGIFDKEAGNLLLDFLRSIPTDVGEPLINKRVVSLLWYMPLFMVWQAETVAEVDLAEFSRISNQIVNQLERILSVP